MLRGVEDSDHYNGVLAHLVIHRVGEVANLGPSEALVDERGTFRENFEDLSQVA